MLELGCGPGTDAAALAEGRRYTGVDLSGVQLAHAHAAVPTGTFLQGDLFDVELRSASFDAVVGLLRVRARSGLEVRRALRADRRMAPTRRTALRARSGPPTTRGDRTDVARCRRHVLLERLRPSGPKVLLRDAASRSIVPRRSPRTRTGSGPATFHWVIARAPVEEAAR